MPTKKVEKGRIETTPEEKPAPVKTKSKVSDKPTGAYSAQSITVLEGLEAVRRRPGMYIGSTGPVGLHHLIWEVVDNSIDESMAGFCNQIDIALLPDHYIEVKDNGRGIPVDIHPQMGVSALEVVMTKLHAGGKFDSGSYKVSGGLHGVGVSVVNALSTHTKAEVHRDGKIWVQEFRDGGKPVKKAKEIGTCKDTGTTITFRADDTIFETIDYDWKTIIDHIRQQAYLSKGIRISITDKREGEEKAQDKTAIAFPNPTYSFYFEGGVASYVRHLNQNKDVKNENVFYIEKEQDNVKVEVALQYSNEFSESLFAFTNNIYNPEGGTHVAGFRTALTRSLNSYARNKGFLKEKDSNLTGEDVREGLVCIISIKVTEPQFEGQTKAKLGNTEVKAAVETVMSEAFLVFLEEHPKDAEGIVEKCLLSARARNAAKMARDTILRKGALEGFTLPGKLADCSSRRAEESELFIVEGDSAGGSAKQGRDREHQAILPLRGKVLNVERARLDKILANNELKSLIIAMGTNIGEQFDISKLRYHRLVIMTDADVDGAHIRTLLLTFFYRYYPALITGGHILIAQPPLYSLKYGKNMKYAYNDEEKEKILAEISKSQSGAAAKNTAKKTKSEEKTETGAEAENGDDSIQGLEINGVKVNIQRYKGLGEMNPEQLWETTMNPQNRMMKRVTIEDAELANEVFEVLMGDEVGPSQELYPNPCQERQ
jgi:DNA gyrase subunit B